MHLGEDIVDAPVGEGARTLLLALLAAADDAAMRLARDDDEEALHDFRVALRRLRSTLRAFRPWLPRVVKRKTVERLRRCARATNVARDAEIQQAWLRGITARLTPRQQAGLQLLCDRVRERAATGRPPRRVVERYQRTASRLARRLDRREHGRAGASRPRFGRVLATLVTEQLAVVRRAMEAVTGSLDEERIHRARIEAKRLRYLVEPLRGTPRADARPVVQGLKRLQDVLGELHDAHLLGHEVRAAMETAARERARTLYAEISERGATGPALRDALRRRPRAGLVAVARIVRERREALFGDLERLRRAGAVDGLAADVRALTTALDGGRRATAGTGAR